MGTSFYAPQPLPYAPYSNPTYTGQTVGYSGTSDPKKAAVNQRAVVQSEGDQFINQDQQLANQYGSQQAGTQAYLNPIENTLATGGGGYQPGEASQIELSPQDKQNIITGAGISAGAGTASAVGAADRAVAASGGNPAAMATYRARAAQTEDANAGDAMTEARIQAQQAGAAGAKTVGDAEIGQQDQALQYYGGLQGQQGQQAQSEQGLGQGAYGTQASGTGQAVGQQIQAAQIPTGWDKLIGGLSGAAGAYFSGGSGSGSGSSAGSSLADGKIDASDAREKGIKAVTGEDGAEIIVENASEPVRTQFYMDDGGGDMSGMDSLPAYNPPAMPTSPAGMPSTGVDGLPAYSPQGQTNPSVPNAPSWASRAGTGLQDYLAKARATQQPQKSGQQAGNRPWSPVDTYSSAGNAIGTAARVIPQLFSADGRPPVRRMSDGGGAPWWSGLATSVGAGLANDIMPGTAMLADGRPMSGPVGPRSHLVTSPTLVNLKSTDMVVPLTHRPMAKVRPSAALPAIRERQRAVYGARA